MFLAKVYSSPMKHEESGVEVKRVKDVVSLYRRAELEKLMWESRLDGMGDDEIASLVGLPTGRVRYSLTKMLTNVQTEGGLLSRAWAIRQTMVLWAEVYSIAAEEWLSTRDPRYAEVMRGALADIRKIWGVDAPQRIQHKHLTVGIVHTELGRMSKDELELLAKLFPEEQDQSAEGLDAGEDSACSCIPELQGLLPSGDS